MNCKEGDKAVLIKANHERNIGRLVEIIRSLGGRDNETIWYARSCGDELLCSPGEVYLKEFAVPDSWLCPYKPIGVGTKNLDSEENGHVKENTAQKLNK